MLCLYSSVTEYGSYPVINPLNETFPQDFNLRRPSTWSVNLTTDKNYATRYIKTDPLPGSWFSAIFISDYVDDKITQKVLLMCKHLKQNHLNVCSDCVSIERMNGPVYLSIAQYYLA